MSKAHGRRDWDFVEFNDYRKDMDDLSQEAISVVEAQAEEIRNLKSTIVALIDAAGGSIAVDDGIRQDAHFRPNSLEVWRDEACRSTMFKVRQA